MRMPIDLRNACVNDSVLLISREKISLPAIEVNGVSGPNDWAMPATRPQLNSRPTHAQLTPNSRPNSRPTHAPLTPNSRPTHAQLTPNSRPTHAQLTPNSRPTHAQLTLNSRSTHAQLTLNSRSTHAQLTLNSHSTHTQLTLNSHSTHTQLTLNSHSTHTHCEQESDPMPATWPQLNPHSTGPLLLRQLGLIGIRVATQHLCSMDIK